MRAERNRPRPAGKNVISSGAVSQTHYNFAGKSVHRCNKSWLSSPDLQHFGTPLRAGRRLGALYTPEGRPTRGLVGHVRLSGVRGSHHAIRLELRRLRLGRSRRWVLRPARGAGGWHRPWRRSQGPCSAVTLPTRRLVRPGPPRQGGLWRPCQGRCRQRRCAGGSPG